MYRTSMARSSPSGEAERIAPTAVSTSLLSPLRSMPVVCWDCMYNDKNNTVGRQHRRVGQTHQPVRMKGGIEDHGLTSPSLSVCTVTHSPPGRSIQSPGGGMARNVARLVRSRRGRQSEEDHRASRSPRTNVVLGVVSARRRSIREQTNSVPTVPAALWEHLPDKDRQAALVEHDKSAPRASCATEIPSRSFASRTPPRRR